MSSKARNYSESTLKKLFALSGNRCAFPNCNVNIVSEDNILFGEICHIEAANEGGERYNPDMTDKERASFENLILLCSNHHIKTNNVVIYTVSELKKMKQEHESLFAKSSADDVSKNITNLLIEQIERKFAQIDLSFGKDDFGVIDDIFDYLAEQMPKRKQTYETITKNNDLTKLRKKVLCNFPNEQSGLVSELVISIWDRKSSVENYLQHLAQEDEIKVSDLTDYIRQLFCQVAGSNDYNIPIKDYNIIIRLSQKITPPRKHNNPQYANNAKAIVFYFFEFCDIGLRIDEEIQGKQGNLFD
jgi:hypothetical protein